MNTSIPWDGLAEVYAFVGNSLLKPMTRTADVGLKQEFWREFSSFGSQEIAQAADACACRSREIVNVACANGRDPVELCAVEYTRLFVGPPSPAAPPWETVCRNPEAVGFGEATFVMKSLLRNAGLELKNENRQYEDHMGIELLFLSALCERVSKGEADPEHVAAYIGARPLAWVDLFQSSIERQCPDGYFQALVSLCAVVLGWHSSLLCN